MQSAAATTGGMTGPVERVLAAAAAEGMIAAPPARRHLASRRCGGERLPV